MRLPDVVHMEIGRVQRVLAQQVGDGHLVVGHELEEWLGHVAAAPSFAHGDPVPGQPERAAGRIAQPHRILDDGVEHGRQVAGRRVDDLQHFGRRGLSLERLLGLVEHARVLDRNHRLVSETLEKRQLLVSKGARRPAHHLDRAHPASFPHHRRHCNRIVANLFGDTPNHLRLVAAGHRIGVVQHTALADGAPRRRTLDRRRQAGGDRLARRALIFGDIDLALRIDQQHCRLVRREQLLAAAQDLPEDRLRVCH